MNEEQKNIETCLPENILSEVANVPTDPQFRSLTDEALDPLKQQALQQAGYDGYIKVAGTHQPYTFTSSVKQMKSNLILLLRRLWRFPFGRGITAASAAGSSADAAPIRSLADMWQHYINRLKGNPEYGIPSRLSQLTDLPSAPALLNDRKIGGVPEAEDGMSMARILCDSAYAATITKITDDTTGWTMKKNISEFPALRRLRLGCAYVLNWPASAYLPTTLTEIEFPELISWGITSEYRPLFIYNNPNITELTFPKCKAIGNGFASDNNGSGCFISLCSNLRVVRFPEMYKYGEPEGGGASYANAHGCLIHSCENLEEVYMPKWTGYRNWRIIRNCPKVWKVVLGNISYGVPSLYDSYTYPFDSLVNLYHLEIAGCTVSLNLSSWNPTTALSDNLQQFLLNFRDVLFTRLAKRTSTTSLTLTLSPEVYKAVYGLDADYNVDPNALAQTASLADFGITIEDLNEIEMAAGITTATKYATWLDTYRGAIYWNVQHS